MAYSTTLTAFAQSVYRAINNRGYDDITGTDGQAYIANVIDFTNQYLDEFETTTDALGQPVYWNIMRQPSYNLGTAVLGGTSITLPLSTITVIPKPKRPVTITAGGQVVSTWMLVKPDQFDTTSTSKLCTQVGDMLYFNQPFVALENGGTITAGVTISLTRIDAVDSDDSVLTIIKPRQLLVLGVAKNSSLPNIVKGGLSPSFVQKYNDLLNNAILFNNATATSDGIEREDFSFVRAVGF